MFLEYLLVEFLRPFFWIWPFQCDIFRGFGLKHLQEFLFRVPVAIFFWFQSAISCDISSVVHLETSLEINLKNDLNILFFLWRLLHLLYFSFELLWELIRHFIRSFFFRISFIPWEISAAIPMVISLATQLVVLSAVLLKMYATVAQ